MKEDLSNLNNRNFLKKFKRLRSKERKLTFINEGIRRADNSDIYFLEKILDPLFENKPSDVVLSNMSLLSNIIENKDNKVSSMLLHSNDLATLVDQLHLNNGFEMPKDIPSFNKKAFNISAYFNSASRLPEEYLDTIIRNGYSAVYTIGDMDYDVINFETDLSLSLGLLAYRDEKEEFVEVLKHCILTQKDYNDYKNEVYEDSDRDLGLFEEDDEEDFEDEGFINQEDVPVYKLSDLKRLAIMADYSRHNLHDFYRENIFPIGRTENMLYSEYVLNELLPLLNNH